MVLDATRPYWAEPRAEGAPGPARRDLVLLVALVVAAVVETLVRDDLVWSGLSLAATVVAAATIPWRRVHPLAVTACTFGMMGILDLGSIVADVDWTGLNTAVFLLMIPYALTRWGAGREVAIGLVVMAVPVVSSAIGGDTLGDVIGGIVVLLLSCALGGAARYAKELRDEELAGLRSREREELARELHDTVAHHVSAIAVRAQAGRAVAATQPDAAADALLVIEEEASRALEEMRAMVGTLRAGDQPDLSPQQGVQDIARLAAAASRSGPAVEVALHGALTELRPSVDAACYRLAQESITNALRHARGATVVRVRVDGDDGCIRLHVEDDGRTSPRPGAGTTGDGFGLVGMAERAKLLGGTFEAGPRSHGGWTVMATLPRHPVSA